jgi:hypothetical protein
VDETPRQSARLSMPVALVLAAVVLAAAIVGAVVVLNNNDEAECDRWREDYRAFADRVAADPANYWRFRNTGKADPELVVELAALLDEQPEGCRTPQLAPPRQLGRVKQPDSPLVVSRATGQVREPQQHDACKANGQRHDHELKVGADRVLRQHRTQRPKLASSQSDQRPHGRHRLSTSHPAPNRPHLERESYDEDRDDLTS